MIPNGICKRQQRFLGSAKSVRMRKGEMSHLGGMFGTLGRFFELMKASESMRLKVKRSICVPAESRNFVSTCRSISSRSEHSQSVSTK